MIEEEKVIIPLIDKNIVPQCFYPNSGFLFMCTYIEELPYLDNHIFLVYDGTKISSRNWLTNKILMLLGSFYNKYYITIDKKSVCVYAFCRLNYLKKNVIKIDTNIRSRIHEFYKYDSYVPNMFIVDYLIVPEIIIDHTRTIRNVCSLQQKGRALVI